MTHTTATRRLTVTLQQLAWYIERDGWRYLRSTDYGQVYGKGTLTVEVPAADVPALDRLRDDVYTRLRTKALKAKGF